jgi:hypothetical protein
MRHLLNPSRAIVPEGVEIAGEKLDRSEGKVAAGIPSLDRRWTALETREQKGCRAPRPSVSAA